jgi:hypothetical protein
MLDPFFLQKLSEFRSQTVDERLPRFHPAAIPAAMGFVEGGEQHLKSSDSQSDGTPEGMLATLFGLTEDSPLFQTGTTNYRSWMSMSQPNRLISLKAENECKNSHSGEGIIHSDSFYSTSAANGYHSNRIVMSVPIHNPTDTDVVIEAGSFFAGGSSTVANAPFQCCVITPDNQRGSVTSYTATQLHRTNSNAISSGALINTAITVPANRTIIISINAANYAYQHSTTYDVTVADTACYLGGMLNILMGGISNAPNYVYGSYDYTLQPDAQVAFNLVSGLYTNIVDVFNGTTDVKKAV